MSSRRVLKIKGISKARYVELFYFCMQYKEKEKQGVEKDIKLIRSAAEAADEQISEYVIKNVTEGVAYEYMDVPCSRDKFYRTRRKFFQILSQSKA